MSMIYWQQLKTYYDNPCLEILETCLTYSKVEKHYLHTTWIVGRQVQGLRGFPARVAIVHLT